MADTLSRAPLDVSATDEMMSDTERFVQSTGTTILAPNKSIASLTVRLARNCQYFFRLPFSMFLFGQLESQNSISFEQIVSSL